MAISGTSMGPKSLTLVLVLACLTCMLSGRVEGKDIMVGDGNWKLDYNYTAWAESNMFMVGDTLVFNYTKGIHNVHSVTGAEFKDCSGKGSIVLESGNDRVALKTAGNMWFLCSKAEGEHCKKGMKFKITVLPATTDLAPAAPPASPPQSKAAPSVSSAASAFMVVILACMAIFLL